MRNPHYHIFDKWARGQATNNERYELEKDALDDPFLGDAMEGIELYSQRSMWNRRQKNLSKRIKKLTNKKRITLRLWHYAAAASILLTGIFFWQNSNNIDDNIELTQQSQELTNKDIEDLAYQHIQTEDISPDNKPVAQNSTSEKTKAITQPSQEQKANLDYKNSPAKNDLDEPVSDTSMESITDHTVTAKTLPPPLITDNHHQDSVIISEETIATSTDQIPTGENRQTMEAIESSKLSMSTKLIDDNKEEALVNSTLTPQSEPIYPLIGREEFNKIINKIGLRKEELFMRQINSDSEQIHLRLDASGLPIEINSVWNDRIMKIMEVLGPWPIQKEEEWITLPLSQFLKK